MIFAGIPASLTVPSPRTRRRVFRGRNGLERRVDMATRRLLRSALAAALLVGAAASARSDEAFYREETREGRLYVFADPVKFGRWEAGATIDGALTREGSGPAGEAVVFDGAAAAALYDARHGAKPSPPEGGEKQGATVTWKDNRTSLRSRHAALDLMNRVQFRFTDQFPDSSVQLSGTPEAGSSLGSFRIRRAKTTIEGWVWRPELEVELQVGWAAADSGFEGSTFSGLEDAALTWDVSKKEAFEIKVGQYKVPFGRQESTSSERLEFVDRDILSGEFTHSRDVGVTLQGLIFGKKVNYRAGIFNGNGRNKPTNDNSKYQYDALVTYSPWGDVKYSEGDFESKDHPLLALGVEFEDNNQFYSTNANNLSWTTFGGVAVFKYRGFSTFVEAFDRKRTPQDGSASFHSNGWHVQAGYFVVRDKVELAFRYAAWDPTDQVPGNDQTETGGAVGYFILKHDLKVQADFRALRDDSLGTTNHELRIQTQFVF
jgi:phosphate-selective porin OprO/OprP